MPLQIDLQGACKKACLCLYLAKMEFLAADKYGKTCLPRHPILRQNK